MRDDASVGVKVVGGALKEGRVQRQLAAVLAADVVGYSRLMGLDEIGTLAKLKNVRHTLIDASIADHNGRIVKTTGDGMLVEFASAVDATQCAVDVQRGMAVRNDAELPNARLDWRIGIHVGDIIRDDDDIFGDGVNIAARLESIAEPGGICISEDAYRQVRGKIDVTFDDRGAQALKNIVEPMRAWRVRLSTDALPPASVTFPVEPAPPLTLPTKPSIAVLPFQNMSGDPEQEYFADGLVEDIITELSRIRWLFVIARNSSFFYKGRAVDVKQTADELGVRYVLEGSVRRGGNRVRINAQLIDAISGTHIWAERYDRELDDFFAVQDEITVSVAGIIEPALAEAEQKRALRKLPERLDAWENYQRGLWHFNQYGPQENQFAQAFFRRASALDPNFAPAHHGYALALQWEIWHYSSRPFSEVQDVPLEEARIAVALDDKDAMAHAVLAHIRMWGSEWEAAIAEARTALSLNPNSAFVISMLGCVLGFGGYREEALWRLQQAKRASPHDPLIWLWTMWTGMIQYYSLQFDAAILTYERLLRMRPGFTQGQVTLAAFLAQAGRIDEARELFKQARARGSRDSRYDSPPWLRPEDNALRIHGIRLAATEAD